MLAREGVQVSQIFPVFRSPTVWRAKPLSANRRAAAGAGRPPVRAQTHFLKATINGVFMGVPVFGGLLTGEWLRIKREQGEEGVGKGVVIGVDGPSLVAFENQPSFQQFA